MSVILVLNIVMKISSSLKSISKIWLYISIIDKNKVNLFLKITRKTLKKKEPIKFLEARWDLCNIQIKQKYFSLFWAHSMQVLHKIVLKRKRNNPSSLLSPHEIFETLKSNKNIFHFLRHMKTAGFKGLFANLKKVGGKHLWASK